MTDLQHRALTAALIGGTGALTGALLFGEPLAIAVSLAGALAAGLIVARGFGRAGGRGWLRAYAAGLAATAIGGGLGAALLAGPEAILLGALFVPAEIASRPIPALAWLVLMGATHWITRAVPRPVAA